MMASNDARAQSRHQFLEAQGWRNATLIPFAADASFRRYFRLVDAERTALLMDAPPPKERTEPFASIARHLRCLGLSAPDIYAADHTDGWLLLEDFGDSTFTRLLGAGHDEAGLYRLACDALLQLQAHPDVNALPLTPYDEVPLVDEVKLFVDWFVPLTNPGLSATEQAAFVDAWRDVLAHLPPLEPTLVLRDYHVDNLMLLPGRLDAAACGLLDFQDALRGSPVYDLASLLEDARRDVSASVVETTLEQYRAGRPTINVEALQCAYTILAAQRHTKVAGIFVRLWRRDGKPHYLRHIPRVLQYLRKHLQQPVLAPVQAWMSSHVDLAATEQAVHALAR